MRVDWPHPTCVLCLTTVERGKLTVEHIIPKSIGGVLTSRLVCRGCNSHLGLGFEAKARLAPEVRQAANEVRTSLPKLVDQLERGASYSARYGEELVEHRLLPNGQLSIVKLSDGSIVVPEADAPAQIRSRLRKLNRNASSIEASVALWESASAASEVDVGHGVVVKKWENVSATPTYNEKCLDPLVPVKIAYEFAALLVGRMIYKPEFQFLRDLLLSQNNAKAQELVNYSWAKSAEPFHGISFGGNNDVARFQVRIFGLLAYTVHFPRIAINRSPFVYTHRFDTNKDYRRTL
jgi:hypothetical protein